ncbi:DNA-3-methyladenine glycosylase 1 [Moraxella macacae 0408225]|uniref:DNA-3-methyladenine glycosylase 1 n=1 Tax=Moraxella macacae 0408225 TaxID=1230338 RepID=L2F562_9GAMM|nr:DNA-3-methyladenine glycosylase I [Moraxella macacae]ELA08179.1 DNA-3-methyladenine glycosylase 1 [Moraxella macacae 0408225]
MIPITKNPPHRCAWCMVKPPLDRLYQAYHDTEWGKPNFNDRDLFAMLCLEGMQAGLSWITILQKRQNYYRAFLDFDPNLIAKFDNNTVDRLMQNDGIVRHRGKIEAIINNAKAYLAITKTQSFSDYLWQMSPNFVENHQKQPLVNHFAHESEIPTKTVYADAMAKQLKKDGFKFVGATTCYAFMQAVGMVNDHVIACDFR